MNFTTKLNEIMAYYKISASALADTINVQRSSISHLLSGRNKPSLDFILKIIDAYPNISFDWLVRDKGDMFMFNNVNIKNTNVNFSSNRIIEPTLFDQADTTTEKKISTVLSHSDKTVEEIKSSSSSAPISKILILFKDGSFEVYQ